MSGISSNDALTYHALPIFFVDLKPVANNKEIYNLKRLLNTEVAFEAPRVKNISPGANPVSILDIPNIIVTTIRDVWNVLVATSQPIALKKHEMLM